jgi:predicted SAM-dependent methyltransferase
LLKDCIRYLEPQGRISIVVPDAKKFIQAYLCEDGRGWSAIGMGALPDDMPTSMCMVNHVFHQGGEHLFGYDYKTLAHLLRSCGFGTVIRSAYRSSDFFEPELDLSCHQHYSLYAEASSSTFG